MAHRSPLRSWPTLLGSIGIAGLLIASLTYGLYSSSKLYEIHRIEQRSGQAAAATE